MLLNIISGKVVYFLPIFSVSQPGTSLHQFKTFFNTCINSQTVWTSYHGDFCNKAGRNTSPFYDYQNLSLKKS